MLRIAPRFVVVAAALAFLAPAVAMADAPTERVEFRVGGYVRGLAMDAGGRLHVTVQCDAMTNVPECADPHFAGVVVGAGSALVRLAGDRPLAVFRDVNDFANGEPANAGLAAFGCDGLPYVGDIGRSPARIWRVDGADPVQVFSSEQITGFAFDCAGSRGKAGLLYYVGDHVETSPGVRDYTIWRVDLATGARSVAFQHPLASWGDSNGGYGLAFFDGALYAAMPSDDGTDGVYRLGSTDRALVFERPDGRGLTSFAFRSLSCLSYLTSMQDAGNDGRVFTSCERAPLTRIVAEDAGAGYSTGLGPWGTATASGAQRGLGSWVAIPGPVDLRFDVEGAVTVCFAPGSSGGVSTAEAICATEGTSVRRVPRAAEYYVYLSGPPSLAPEFAFTVSQARS